MRTQCKAAFLRIFRVDRGQDSVEPGRTGQFIGIRLFSMALALRSGFEIEGEHFIDRGCQGQWGSAPPDDVPFTK